MKTPKTLTIGLALVLAGALSACGGGDAPSAETTRSASAATLLDDDGNVLPATGAVPADDQARTRSGLYASTAQAADLVRALGSRVLEVDLDCCGTGAGGADLAVKIAFGVQAAADLDNDTPVLVRSRDARLAAATADRLTDAGYGRVVMVTP